VSDVSPERLEMLYRVSQALASTLDLGSVLNAVVDQVIAVTKAERGFLMPGVSRWPCVSGGARQCPATDR